MKRKFKRIASFVLAMVMVFAMAMPAMATEGSVHEGSMSNPADLSKHIFKAYQIFSGMQAEGDGEEAQPLGNIEWGGGIESVAFLSDLQGNEKLGTIFSGCETARDVAEAIAEQNWGYDSELANEFAKVAYAHKTGDGIEVGDTAPAGYYLVVDETTDLAGENEVLNLALLQFTTAGKFEATTKVDVPTSDKGVKDKNDSTGVEDVEYQKTADYDIGDDIPFQLKGTVAQNYNDYETYTFIFHDVQSEGLELNEETVKVYVNNELLTNPEGGAPYYTLNTSTSDGCTFEIVFSDLKQVSSVGAGSVITVEYTSKLTGDAVVVGNDGNPNTMHLEYSNNPNDKDGGTGRTPDTTVVVFTYDLEVDKINDKGDALDGAGFTLYKKDKEGNYKQVGDEKVFTDGSGSIFDFKGLDDGDYRLVETTTPPGYNTMEPIEFTVTAEHGEKLTKLEVNVTKGAASDALKSDLDGTGSTEVDLKKGEKKKLMSGHIFGEIVNNEGTTLPETGGIGTTIFYVVGSVLVLGAVILLVTKRRMKSE